jgi:ABC-type glycerol-3-phosphate transport system substrate-binding protein
VLYWNRDLFMRARLGPARGPATWDELRDAASRIQQLGDGVHGFGVALSDSGASFRPVVPFLLGNGGGLLTAMFDSSRFASPQNVQALIYLKSLRPSSLLAGDDSLAREFAAGRLGMVLAGSELALRLAKSAPSVRYGLELVPRPGPDRGTHASIVAGEVLVSFTSSRRKEDALKLARFLVRDENAHGLATALQFMQPPNRSADTTAWYRARPEQLIMFRQIDAGQYLPNHRDWAAMHRVIGIQLGAAVEGRLSALQAITAADTFITSQLGSR